MDIGDAHYPLLFVPEIWGYSHLFKTGTELKANYFRDNRGFVLVLALLLLLVVTLIGISALNTGTHDVLISGNERASVQAFYIAEAGINEFMGRFRTGAANQISDSTDSKANPIETTPPWKILFAKSPGMGAAKIGFGSSTPNTTSIPSLQTQLDFGVEVIHKVDVNKKLVLVNNLPVYIVKSYALYSEMPVHIHGGSTYINGNDACGSTNHKPGIITTTTTTPPITESGNPNIDGSPPKVTLSSSPPPTNLPVKEMLDYLKGNADFKYSYSQNQTLTGVSDSWGVPTSNGTTQPLTYTGPMNIVYFNMNGDKTLKLAGGSHGAGVLIVDGNLELHGGFVWFGLIIITGSLDYTGGGEKNVTGGILTGESTTVQVDIGGNAGIIYCSDAIKKLKDSNKIPSFKVTKWREIF